MASVQIPWAPGAKYIKIICRLGEPRPDAADPDPNPDLMPQGGSVRLICNAKKIRYTESDGRSRMLSTREWTFKIDAATGELYNEAPRELGVYILSGDSAGVDPRGFTWTAIVTPEFGDSWSVTIPPVGVDVVDLVTFADVVPPSEGQSTLSTRMAQLENRMDNFAAPSGRGVKSITDADGDGVATIEYTDSKTEQLQLPKGKDGKDSTVPGPANKLTIGNVTTVAPTEPAEVNISGETPNQSLSFFIPRGLNGQPGKDSTVPGPANSLSIGTVTTGAAGSNASANITGTAPTQKLDLTIPRGPAGPAGPTFGADGSIIAAGRPDVPATMDSATQSAVAAAPSGTFFRSTDGPQGAWIWMKRGTTWGVVDADTGARKMVSTTLDSGFIVIRRTTNTVVVTATGGNYNTINIGILQGAMGFTNVVVPSGFEAVGFQAFGLITKDGGSVVGHVQVTDKADGSQIRYRAASGGGTDLNKQNLIRVSPVIYVCDQSWPTTLPGTPA